jgi:LDH2 family malate/lactate/ureidoglycolate dehydrogenase
MSDFVRIPYSQLLAAVSDALCAAGLAAEQAAIEAEVMVEADLLEVPSHGIRMLPPLLSALRDGRVSVSPQIGVLRDFGAVCSMDAGNGPGRYASWRAMQAAMTKAEQYGIGLCVLSHATHWGRAHAYASRAAQSGLIALCVTNAMPTMQAWGSLKAVLGNNPIAIGIPGVVADEPLVLDMAMSQAAVGKVGTWLREGKPLPEGWGIDASGHPTSDANAILQGGAVSAMGGHKGMALSFMFELLTGALTGGLLCHQIGAQMQGGIETESSKLFIAIKPEALIDISVFSAQREALLAYLRQDATSPAGAFLYPGERGWLARRANLHEGVPVHADIVTQLRAASVAL